MERRDAGRGCEEDEDRKKKHGNKIKIPWISDPFKVSSSSSVK